MSCLADSNLTAIREGLGWRWRRYRDVLCCGGVMVALGCDICSPSHRNQPASVCVCVGVCLCVCLYYFILLHSILF